ncbi:MAG: polymer-forming cytoskeletal protein [Pseudomonadota bacterium]
MFSKAKPKQASDERRTTKSIKTMNSASEAAVPNNSAPAASKRSSSMKSAGVPSIFSADVVVKGNINSVGEVQLDGELEGDIKSAVLIVGEKATVKGEIVCENVTVRGRVEGGIRAKQVTLASTAHILGDILHSSLAVESGAHFEGNCRHSDDPLSDSSAKDFRKSRPGGAAPRPTIVASAEAVDDGDDDLDDSTPSFLNPNRSPLR